jgi:hypothetical protein
MDKICIAKINYKKHIVVNNYEMHNIKEKIKYHNF